MTAWKKAKDEIYIQYKKEYTVHVWMLFIGDCAIVKRHDLQIDKISYSLLYRELNGYYDAHGAYNNIEESLMEINPLFCCVEEEELWLLNMLNDRFDEYKKDILLAKDIIRENL